MTEGSSDDLFDWSQFGYIGGWRWLPFIIAFFVLLFSSIYLFITRHSVCKIPIYF